MWYKASSASYQKEHKQQQQQYHKNPSTSKHHQTCLEGSVHCTFWLALQMRLQQMYEDTHLAMLQLDARVLDVPWLWKHTFYFRCVLTVLAGAVTATATAAAAAAKGHKFRCLQLDGVGLFSCLVCCCRRTASRYLLLATSPERSPS
jgi:hypothetical protein